MSGENGRVIAGLSIHYFSWENSVRLVSELRRVILRYEKPKWIRELQARAG